MDHIEFGVWQLLTWTADKYILCCNDFVQYIANT